MGLCQFNRIHLSACSHVMRLGVCEQCARVCSKSESSGAEQNNMVIFTRRITNRQIQMLALEFYYFQTSCWRLVFVKCFSCNKSVCVWQYKDLWYNYHKTEVPVAQI